MLFEGALDVDFSVVPADVITVLDSLEFEGPLFAEVVGGVGRGYRIVLDKNEQLAPILSDMTLPAPTGPTSPSQWQLTEMISDFWYHCVWIAKKASLW